MTLVNLPRFLGREFVRREDLLKPDVMSEVILLGFGAILHTCGRAPAKLL